MPVLPIDRAADISFDPSTCVVLTAANLQAALLEVDAELAAIPSSYQPLDGDLTAIAALTGTNTLYYRQAANAWAAVTIGGGLSFSGGTLQTSGVLLTANNLSELTATAATARSNLGLGTMAVEAASTYLTVAAAAAGYQPLDSDLTAIAALTTTSFGRSLLTQADAATARTTLGAGTGTIGGTVGATDNRLVRSDGTGAATVQSTGITVDDSNNVSGVGTISSGAITSSGALVGIGTIGNSATVSAMDGFDFSTTAGTVLIRQGGTRWVGWKSIGAVFSNAGGIGFAANGAASAFTSAVYEVSTGWRLQADGGLTVRNLANSADAAITAGAITANALMCAGAYTVATLPSASANAGKFAQVTDSSVTTNGSTVSGGGSNRVMVFSNGTNWKVIVA